MPNPSTRPSGVQWVVLRQVLTLVQDSNGRQLYQRWNPRLRLTERTDKVIGHVYADTKAEARTLALAYFPGAPAPEVQSAASYALAQQGQSAIRRDRLPPKLHGTTARRPAVTHAAKRRHATQAA